MEAPKAEVDSAHKAELAKRAKVDSLERAFKILWDANEMNNATLDEKNAMLKRLLGPLNKIYSDAQWAQREEPATD
jgi:hypothetical protein